MPVRTELIWDGKRVAPLPSLLPEFAGKVNLLYIDPPFDTGADFSFTATVHSGRRASSPALRGLTPPSGGDARGAYAPRSGVIAT
jgi:hypothetical protein